MTREIRRQILAERNLSELEAADNAHKHDQVLAAVDACFVEAY